MGPTKYENDELIFLDEDDGRDNPSDNRGYWNVLLVDDDEEIHSVSKLALADLTLNNKKLKFYHAYSGKEALSMLEELGEDIAVILLDVVMETDDAGLVVAKKMREELGLFQPRIVLRTGQPGYAPEESVIKEYDINDYKTKTELTRSKLVTTMIASLRSYHQLRVIEQSRVGLEKIIKSSANLLEEHSVKGFSEGVITQISSLIGLDAGGVLCARAGSVLDQEDDSVYVLGAAGQYANFINEKLENLNDELIVEKVNYCLRSKQHIYRDHYTVLYLHSSDYEAAVFVKIGSKISATHRQLIEVFLSSISIGYENVNLFHQLRNAAFRDWLTKLPNRTEFINMLDTAKATGCDPKFNTVALIDVKHFSDINDGLGQETGNKLLIAITERMREAFGLKVKIGRIAADVFGVIGERSELTVEKLSEIFESPFQAGDHLLPINITAGFCDVSQCKSTGIDVLKQANIALNRAKKSVTSNFEFYMPEMEEKTTWRLGMIRQLRSDFSSNKLEVWYQPQVDLITEEVVGMEALLRWPTGDGFISPSVFVPLAEYSGLIIDIGAWVIEEACKQLHLLQQKGKENLRVAVNISIPQFRDPQFVSLVKSIALKYQIKPQNIELEITESVVMDEPQIVVDSLKELKAFGFTIAIDDFGTGFSSMSYLQQLPLDRLKVDRSFVIEVTPGKSAFIAETIVTLGNKLGLLTIAEGVETRAQASYMLKLGCDEAQGYLFAKPMPFDALCDFLERSH
ncbi:EAL domain-containing protein [Alteromonadaceae bacterium M269]|nr:EAL domain-containing protein [Alteromonadaceae bacterium M269]